MNIEHKLDLIQQIHREQAENERNFYRRYRYRESDYHDYGVYGRNLTEEKEGNSGIASFRLRLLIAVLLFLCFFLMDKKEVIFEGIGCSEIVECISSNFLY